MVTLIVNFVYDCDVHMYIWLRYNREEFLRSINWSDTNIKGEKRTVINRHNNKIDLMDIKLFRHTEKKTRMDTIKMQWLKHV
jgi:hypothetical protein